MEKENTGGKREHLSMAKKIPGPKITPMFFDKMLWFMFFLNQLPNSEVFPECLLCVRQRSTCMEAHHETKQAANPDHAKYKFQSLPGMFQAPDWIPNRQKKKKRPTWTLLPVLHQFEHWHPSLHLLHVHIHTCGVHACMYACSHVWVMWACMCVNMSVRMTSAAFPSHFPSSILSQNLSLYPELNKSGWYN